LKKELLFTAKSQRAQRKPFLFTPVRGGIEQTSPGLRPNNYPEGSEGLVFAGLSPANTNYLLCALSVSAVKTIFQKAKLIQIFHPV
jgi:hypothetical protein